jgi:hypothetical protein
LLPPAEGSSTDTVLNSALGASERASEPATTGVGEGARAGHAARAGQVVAGLHNGHEDENARSISLALPPPSPPPSSRLRMLAPSSNARSGKNVRLSRDAVEGCGSVLDGRLPPAT